MDSSPLLHFNSMMQGRKRYQVSLRVLRKRASVEFCINWQVLVMQSILLCSSARNLQTGPFTQVKCLHTTKCTFPIFTCHGMFTQKFYTDAAAGRVGGAGNTRLGTYRSSLGSLVYANQLCWLTFRYSNDPQAKKKKKEMAMYLNHAH